MKTIRLNHVNRIAPFPALLVTLLTAQAVQATFHLMQIEQITVGVDGDNSRQAIQLRMRSGGQNIVSEGRIRAWDATGNNPITIIDFATDVTNESVGDRVFVVSTNLGEVVVPQLSAPGSFDFQMTNQIPPTYFAAGSLTFEEDNGLILWRLSWGGANYTGPTTGSTTNDADGEFGKFASGLDDITGTRALKFPGAANTQSTNNAADYQLITTGVVYTNNARCDFDVDLMPTCGMSDLDMDMVFDDCDICVDPDNDGFGNPGFMRTCCPNDNCPAVANADQADADGDSVGDACDTCTDTDGDGLGNPGFAANTCAADNCPGVANPTQTDTDGDGLGDACDNCDNVVNADQADADADSIGDACDTCIDSDGDGFGNPGVATNTCSTDNCPSVANATQADADGDGLGDDCDNCPNAANVDQADTDADGVGDTCDTVVGDGNGGGSAACGASGNCGTGMMTMMPMVVAGVGLIRRGRRAKL